MNIKELHPSKWLAASDLEEQGEAAVTISKVTFEKMKNKDGNEEEKPVIWFRGVQKGMVLNNTNKQRILAQHPAEDTDEWIGKRITIQVEPVEAFGKITESLRVKLAPPQRKPAIGAAAPTTAAGAFGGDELPDDVGH